MNYSTLFPEMLKQVPRIKREDMCYHYQYQDNDNNHTKLYIPSGKRLLLWFLNFNEKNYSVILEFNDKTEKIEQCYFQYMSFKPELTEGCGTLLWCTKINKQFCLNKIIYWMGNKYTKYKYTVRLIHIIQIEDQMLKVLGFLIQCCKCLVFCG